MSPEYMFESKACFQAFSSGSYAPALFVCSL